MRTNVGVSEETQSETGHSALKAAAPLLIETLMAESWATEQELSFLKNLGTYREGHESTAMRLRLLENYLKAARDRVDWGTVNRETVIQFAKDQLSAERRKAS